jgi:hypothetical protein
VYDLEVTVVPKGDIYTLVCRTLHLISIEVFARQNFLAGAPASENKPVELSVPVTTGTIEVRGRDENKIVARRVITLPALAA